MYASFFQPAQMLTVLVKTAMLLAAALAAARNASAAAANSSAGADDGVDDAADADAAVEAFQVTFIFVSTLIVFLITETRSKESA
jgi:hypothetical protein